VRGSNDRLPSPKRERTRRCGGDRSVIDDGAPGAHRLSHASGRSPERRASGDRQRTAVETAYAAIQTPASRCSPASRRCGMVGVVSCAQRRCHARRHRNGVFVGPRMYWPERMSPSAEGAGAMTGLSPDIQLAAGSAVRRGQQSLGGAAEDPRAGAPRRGPHQGAVDRGGPDPRQQSEIHRIHAGGAAGRRRRGRQFRSPASRRTPTAAEGIKNAISSRRCIGRACHAHRR